MPYLFADEGARQSNNRPEENATAQDDLSVEAVAQVTEDGSRHHEAADEDCGGRKKKEKNISLDMVTYDCYRCMDILHFAVKPSGVRPD